MASSRVARALIFVGGGILLAVSPFLAWVRILGLFNVDLFTLLRVAGHPSSWAWLAVVAGAGVVVAGIGSLHEGGETTARVGVGVIAAVVVVAGAPGVTRLVHVVTESRGLAGIGPGLILAALSEAALLLGIALPRRATHLQIAVVARDEESDAGQLPRDTERVGLTPRALRRVLAALLAVVVLCGVGVGAYLEGRSASPTGFTVLAPATVPPVYAECNVPVSDSTDGNLYPLLCPNGGVNIRAWDGYTRYIDGPLFELGRNADAAVVLAAMCQAYYHKPADATSVEVQSAEELAAAYYGWNFHVATHFLTYLTMTKRGWVNVCTGAVTHRLVP